MSRVLLVLVAVLAGCSLGDSALDLQPAAVSEATARVRAEGTFAFSAIYIRQLPDEPDEEYLTLEGAVDVGSGSGRLTADLSLLLPSFAEPVELAWTREELVAKLDGEQRETSRGQARESGGLIGRLPDEPAALVDLLGRAEGVRRVGDGEVDGRDVVRFSCSVEARRAGAAGVPAELAPAFEEELYGPQLPLEVWLDADGLPRRIEYVIRLKPLVSGGKRLLPARVVRGRYELSDFGERVAVGN